MWAGDHRLVAVNMWSDGEVEGSRHLERRPSRQVGVRGLQLSPECLDSPSRAPLTSRLIRHCFPQHEGQLRVCMHPSHRLASCEPLLLALLPPCGLEPCTF